MPCVRAQSSIKDADERERVATLQTRAAAVIRNLAHNQRNHAVLIQAGAVDPLVEIMRKSTVSEAARGRRVAGQQHACRRNFTAQLPQLSWGAVNQVSARRSSHAWQVAACAGVHRVWQPAGPTLCGHR